jgi:hypothetical protein
MWDVVLSFQNIVWVGASQKTTFGTPKMKNALFIGQKENRLHSIPRHPKVHARVLYGLAPSTYTMIKAVT